MSKQRFFNLTLLVREYDEAIDFYTQKLNFELVEDTRLTQEKRWVRVRPPGKGECCLLLAKASTPDQEAQIGNQTGGRVFLFLQTNNLDEDYHNLLLNKVQIVREPSNEEYGKVLVFADLYGNLFDLIEPNS